MVGKRGIGDGLNQVVEMPVSPKRRGLAKPTIRRYNTPGTLSGARHKFYESSVLEMEQNAHVARLVHS